MLTINIKFELGNRIRFVKFLCMSFHFTLPSPICPSELSTLSFTGAASVTSYQALLRSLTYTNLAPEPTPGSRNISITISDGIHQDVSAIIIIVVLSNDNPLMLQASTLQLTLIEGDITLSVGQDSGIELVDIDRDSYVTLLTVQLEDAREADAEFLVLDLSALGGEGRTGVEITVNQTSTLQNYQVH